MYAEKKYNCIQFTFYFWKLFYNNVLSQVRYYILFVAVVSHLNYNVQWRVLSSVNNTKNGFILRFYTYTYSWRTIGIVGHTCVHCRPIFHRVVLKYILIQKQVKSRQRIIFGREAYSSSWNFCNRVIAQLMFA